MEPQSKTSPAATAIAPVLINEANLCSFRTRLSLLEYVRQIHRRRHFIVLDARTRAFQKNRDYRLGQFWLVVSPLLDSAMYALIFGYILNTGHGVNSFLGYLVLGVSYFAFLTGFINTGAGLVQSSRNMIQSFSFPRASLVLSAGIRCMIDNIAPAIVGVIAAILFQIGEPLHWTAIMIVPIFLLMHIFGIGIMFLTARLTAILLDFRALLTIFNRLWFYGSGVFYSIDRFALPYFLSTAMTHNPAYVFLSAIRGSVLYGQLPSLATWQALVAWSVGTFVVGFVWFWRGEETYINAIR